MNRAFTAALSLVAACLALLLVGLIISAVAELATNHMRHPPDPAEIFFAVRLSLLTASIAALLAVLVAVPVAYLLARYSFPGKSVLDTLLDLPIVLSPIALGALLLIFFNTPPGRVLNQQFGPFVFEVKGIILAQFLVIIGLAVRMLKGSFAGVDSAYERLACTLGYNRFQVFRRVTLPLARRGILATLLLVWGRAVGEFGATLTLAGAMTMKTETIPVAIFLSFESTDISTALVFILILIGVSLAILFAVRQARIFNYE